MTKKLSAFLLTLCLCALCFLPPAGAMASETHTHFICGATGCSDASHSHSGTTTWTALSSITDNQLTEGSYYLTGDITDVSSLVRVSGHVNLCLNGHTIRGSAYGMITVQSGASLTICDCGTNGKIETTNSTAIVNEGTLTLYGGRVQATGENGEGIFNEGTVTVSGGEVIGSYGIFNSGTLTVKENGKVTGSATGISNEATITINGGEVIGSYGIFNSGTLTVSGGTVLATGENGEGILNFGTLTVSDGTVQATSENGFGISNYDTVKVNGGEVIGSLYGIYNDSNGKVTVSGGEVIGSLYGIFNSGTLTVSGGIITSDGRAIENNHTLNLSGAPALNGKAADVYLAYECIVIIGTSLTPSEPYTVSLSEPLSPGSPYVFTNAGKAEYLSCFTHAENTYEIIAGDDGALVLKAKDYTITVSSSNEEHGTVEIHGTTTGKNLYAGGATVEVRAAPSAGYSFAGWMNGAELVSTLQRYSFTVSEALALQAVFVQHEHSWVYSASGSQITAACANTDGACPNTAGGEVTIVAPIDLVYDGSAKPVSLSVIVGMDTVFSDLPAIQYWQLTDENTWIALSGEPVDAGTYKAALTIKGVTAEAAYTIRAILPDGPAHDVDITVNGQPGVTYTNAAVKVLAAGNTKPVLQSSLDLSDGKGIYHSTLPDGLYNLVITATQSDGRTVTVTTLADLMEHDDARAVQLPEAGKNSTVDDDISRGIIAGGVERIAAGHEIAVPGGYLEAQLKAQLLPPNQQADLAVFFQKASGENKKLDTVLDIDLYLSQFSAEGKETGKTAITDTKDVKLQIVIPIRTAGRSAEGFTVYRVHGGQLQQLPYGGDFFTVDTVNQVIVLNVSCFSSYAIAYGDPVAAAPSIPRTGDDANLALWCALCLISLAGAVVLLRRRAAR